MKIRTKCFLTVLITYLSMCSVSWCACHGLIASGADPWWTILAAGIIAIILSSVGVQLKVQPKRVLLSYIITVIVAWFSALLLFFIFEGVMGSADGLSTVIYLIAMALDFPGFAFLMAISEFGTSSAETLSTVLYFLCGLIPVAVTLISVKSKKRFFKTISIVSLLISLSSLFVAIFFEDKGSFLDLSIVVQIPAAIIAFICFILAVVLWKYSKKRET